MLSSLFPRNSIYKSLDDEGHGHAFDAGNTALFQADELAADDSVDGQVDHAAGASGITGQQRRHQYHPSLPDPFEHMPKTGTIPAQLPLIKSVPTSPSASPTGRDRATSATQEGDTTLQRSTIDPFAAHNVDADDPMAAFEQRFGAPYGESTRLGARYEDDDPHTDVHPHDEAGPPKSIMFGVPRSGTDTVYDEASMQYRRPAAASPTRTIESEMQSQLASSSHIVGGKQQVPWWLRENRKRLGVVAEASSSRSIGMQGFPAQASQQIPGASVKSSRRSTPTNSPATHTMFLPTHASPSSHAQQTSSPSSNVRAFVQNVYNVSRNIVTPGGSQRQGPIHLQTHLSKKDKALWNWVNVDDLDEFLQEVYTFYVKKGIWSIALAGFLDLLTIGFVIGFSIFLLGCVDYSVIRNSHSLGEVVVPRCVSRFHGATLLLFLSLALFYSLRIVKFGKIIKRLFVMRDFFTELLEIPESDIQTVPWPVIVEKISLLRSEHPAVAQHEDFTDLDEDVPKPPSANKPRLDAHDVANRIMRKENYFIAMFNKNVLNTAIPIPPLLARSRSFNFLSQKLGLVTVVIAPGDTGRTALPRGAENASAALLTKVLEWNLKFCLLGFLFGPDGQVRRQFVSERNKKDLVQALQRRFILMGWINALFAPFIILYLLFYSFFRYFEEYHKNPSSLGMRSYTQLARWKFREFNELPHIFQMRLHRSYPLAEAYVSQFPNDRMAQLARFVAFISGSFASVLVLFSLIDPDAFLHFEITPERTVLFYIGIFGSLMAIARGMVPDDHRVVDPDALMREVIEETHYMPAHWRGNLHSADVHREFSLLFPLKVASFFHEILSVLTTPLVLWFTLPRCSSQIIDFFREFTIHVDGLGYVCSFAVFDFAKTGLGDVRYGAPAPVIAKDISSINKIVEEEQEEEQESTNLPSQSGMESGQGTDVGSQYSRPRILIDERLVADQGKLEKSIIGFKAAHPTWQPQDQSTSLYLSRMTELASNSMYLPPPSTATRRDFSQHRQAQQGVRSAGGRSAAAGRRSRHVQPSPFGSPIFEDEDNLPPIENMVSRGFAGVVSPTRNRGRPHEGQVSHRVPHSGRRGSQQQQYDYNRATQERADERSNPSLHIKQEQHHLDEDEDPYIRPDESRAASLGRNLGENHVLGDSTSVAREDEGNQAKDGGGHPPSDITGVM